MYVIVSILQKMESCNISVSSLAWILRDGIKTF